MRGSAGSVSAAPASFIRRRRASLIIGQSAFFSQLWSVRFGAGEFDDLGPLFGFVGEEFSKPGRRHRHRLAAEVLDPGLDLRIGEAGGDRGVELVDNLTRSALGRAGAIP